MEKKRIYLYDNLKFFLIFFVVLGHFIDQGIEAYEQDLFYRMYIFIYAFHMPLFIFISGLFFKDKNITKKVFYYLATGITMSIVIFCFKHIVYHSGSLDFVYVMNAPWFMIALAAFTLLTHFLRDIDKRLILIISIIFACFAGYTSSFNDFLCVSRIIVFYPFYLAGTMLDADKIAEVSRKKPLRITGGVLIAAWTAACIFGYEKVYTLRKLFTGRNPFERLLSGMAPFGWEYRVLCYVISAALCFALICVIPSRKIPFISYSGTKTIQVYFWHLPMIYIIQVFDVGSVFAAVPWGAIGDVFICFAITLLLSLPPFAYPSELIRKYTFSPVINKENSKNL